MNWIAEARAVAQGDSSVPKRAEMNIQMTGNNGVSGDAFREIGLKEMKREEFLRGWPEDRVPPSYWDEQRQEWVPM